jgi:uncharacterized protein YcnI
MTRLGLRLLGGAAVVAVTMVATTLPAFAHVTVNSDDATQGAFSKLSFRVPNETDNTSTTKVEVFFPASQPLGFVSVKPHAGWSFTETKGKLAKPITTDDGPVSEYVSSITWTASSAAVGIKPGMFDEFEVSAGPLPKAASMQFKTLQSYSDGSVVRWIENTPASGAEPEHPAPTLKLTAAGASDTAAATTPASKPAAAPTSSSDSASKGSVNLAIALSVLALLIGLLGGAAGATALRRKATPTLPATRQQTKAKV